MQEALKDEGGRKTYPMWTPIAPILGKYIKQKSLDKKFQEATLFFAWDNVLNDLYKRGAARFTKVVGVKDNVLYVRVYNSLWVAELEGNKYVLLNLLKKHYPSLTQISFRCLPLRGQDSN